MPRVFVLISALLLGADSSRGADGSPGPSFVNDVVPLLTKLGCNQGACHGKAAGQNGFRLSLRGYAPEQDHASITRESAGRRINPAVPEQSLLLLKPIGLARHDGGKLLTVGSREHQLLLAWLRAGAPGPKADEPKLTRIVLTPAGRAAKTGDTIALQAEAQFSDGSRRDVTWLTRFDTNDAAVVTVTPDGVASVRGSGETVVRASFQTEVATAIITAPFPQTVSPERYKISGTAIDEHVYRKLAALNVEPSDLCDDASFIRRASLDAMGTLPTPAEVRSFLADADVRKRAKLVDELLDRPEWVDYWTLQLCDLLQNRKERDHDVRGPKGVRTFHEWVRRQLSANRSWDAIARDVLTATGPTTTNPAVGYFIVTVGEQREAHRSEVVASVAQSFLGTRIGCAQCHNHPLERYTQDDYYHFAAYFSRIRFERKESKDGPSMLRVSHPDPNQNRTPVGVSQPRTGKFMAPQPLDHSELAVTPQEDPRTKLAAWITGTKNEYFSGAMVNRVWRHFLGIGLVEPVDDLRATNPPSNPELWLYLNREFVGHGFDLKYLMRLILNSRTYQLESATRPGNRADTRYYSHYYARRLPAEVLADAICAATGVPDQYPGYPLGLRAIQLPDPSVKSSFLALFGRSDRVTACACERGADVAMVHTLHLLNGDDVARKIEAPDGTLARLVKEKKEPNAIVDDLFFATLGRIPTAEERARIGDWIKGKPFDAAALADVFWALLNSKEFVFNH
jgi:hypothetical protein